MQIIASVRYLLDQLFREGYQYKQAGVILGELQNADGVQLDLFAPDQAQKTARHKRLMQAMDAINSRFGSNQLHFAVQGTNENPADDPAGFMRPHSV